MTLGAGGCGPTTIANIVSPLLKKNITPAKVWDYMKKNGYLIPGAGSTWNGITQTLKHYGIRFTVTYNDDMVKKSLEKGDWVLALAGASRWTSSGHYFCIYKLKKDGKLSISDPYSGTNYCQEDGYLAEYLRANKCNWISIDPSDYPGGIVPPKKEQESKTVTLYVDTAKANIRKGRGLEYGVKGVVDRGTKLKLYSLVNDCYKIKAGKYRGYYIHESVLTRFEPWVNIQLAGKFLRRPISVCDWNEETLTIVYKVVGHGTEAMSSMRSGEKLDILTGLGNGYDLSLAGEYPVLIGGGVGVPPMYGAAKRLAEQGIKATVILGFNTASEIFYEEQFKALGCDVTVTTVDGSYGVKGFVTNALPETYTYFYTCGPEPMLKAVYKATSTSGQMSFEERMGCSCKTLTGYKRICKEGPVMKKEEILWES